jgi:putative membrane-bound dehydrogenase-like protein
MKGCCGLMMALCFAAMAGFAESSAGEVTLGERTLRIAEGYTVEVAAGQPLVERPIAVSTDDKGRLYVTDSAGMSGNAIEQQAAKPHRLRRLEDTNGDGVYDKSVVFAEGLMFPEGCLWHQGSVYVAAPPQIWKFTDDNDDGVSDRREVWFDGETLTGCANDLHGPYLGLEGQLYWCKGAFAEQQRVLPSGETIQSRAGHVLRKGVKDGPIESVMTGGMDNPVNVAFLSTGERILSCTFLQHPEAGRRDGLLHAIYGGVYGKEHDAILEHPRTGSVMPVLLHQGAAAPCGLIAGSPSLLGGGQRDVLFACYFNLHHVGRHVLSANAATYGSTNEEFLACDHPDFHPTDVFEDGDGSLLIVDTGGWYKVCCPTSQIAKPDVLGAIYRVKKVHQPVVKDPYGKAIAWEKQTPEQLVSLLAESRPRVQRQAMERLRMQGPLAAAAVAAGYRAATNSELKQRLLWTLAGMDESNGQVIQGQSGGYSKRVELLKLACTDTDAEVRHTAASIAAVCGDNSLMPQLIRLLADESMLVRRAAAEALGRSRDPLAIPSILEALAALPAGPCDGSGAPAEAGLRVIEHSLLYALLELQSTEPLATLLDSQEVSLQRGAMVVLDQMLRSHVPEKLAAQQPILETLSTAVVAALGSEQEAIKNTAGWIVQGRPEWSERLLQHYAEVIDRIGTDDSVSERTAAELGQLARSGEIQQLLASGLGDGRVAVVQLALEAIKRARLPATPDVWLDGLASQMMRYDSSQLMQALDTLRQLPLSPEQLEQIRPTLIALAELRTEERNIVLTALQLQGGDEPLSPTGWNIVRQALPETEPYADRNLAAQIVAARPLSAEQVNELLTTIPQLGPLELPRVLSAFRHIPDREHGLLVLEALSTAPGLSGIRPDQAKQFLSFYPDHLGDEGHKLMALVNPSQAEQAQELEHWLTSLPEGNRDRGQQVFLGSKVACVSCHQLGYQGGKLGPDLSEIGKIRNRRDLMEAVAFPNSSIVRGYESVIVELDDGRVVTGIIVQEDKNEITLAIDAKTTQRVSRASIEAMTPSKVSPMPQGIAKALTPQELADLIVFLESLKSRW